MKKYTQLTAEEREKIFDLRQSGYGIRSIAKEINRDKGTISRELFRNRYKDSIEYLPDKAHDMAKKRKHILLRKIDSDAKLKNYIFEKLKIRWSPDIIAAKSDEDIQIKISRETIYSYIYHAKKPTFKVV